MAKKPFTKDVLILDPEKEVNKISSRIRELLSKQLKRRGLVVALSGGIDSSVTTALAVKAIGPERVIVLLMPEQHSADETLNLSSMVADHFGVEKIHEDISDILGHSDFTDAMTVRSNRLYPNMVRAGSPRSLPPMSLKKKASTCFPLWLKARMERSSKNACP